MRLDEKQSVRVTSKFTPLAIVSSCVKNINNNSCFIVLKEKFHKTCTPLNLIDRLKDYLIDMYVYLLMGGNTHTSERKNGCKKKLPNKYNTNTHICKSSYFIYVLLLYSRRRRKSMMLFK